MAEMGIKLKVVQQICQLAEENGVEQVILFGSRARGDYNRASDIDLAVKGGDVVRFTLDVEEKTDTLLKFDVIDMEQPIQKKLRTSIVKEGVILYGKI